MLRPKKKISKKEMKEDRLVTMYAEVTGFYEKNKRNIHIGITAVVVLALVAVVYVKNRSDNEALAMAQLGKVHSLFDAGSYQQAIDGVAERNIPGLKSIVDNYGGTPSGELARFYMASSLFELHRYDEALEQFREFSPSEELLVISRYAGIAQCLEAKGEYGGAAEYYEKAATKDAKAVDAAENLSLAARNFALAGEKEKALELYKRVKKNYPLTTHGREADRYIAALSV